MIINNMCVPGSIMITQKMNKFFFYFLASPFPFSIFYEREVKSLLSKETKKNHVRNKRTIFVMSKIRK